MEYLSNDVELDNLEEIIIESEMQVKSKKRVKDHGEVFTNKREVNAMLDLVSDEASRVDSRFLEPACGNGNFLVAILRRKLDTVVKEHNADQADFEEHTFMAVASIYAIDIQEDNCQEARERMYNIVKDLYDEVYPASQDSFFLDSIKFLLELNIILGNGLTGLRGEESTEGPIVFSEFTFEGDVVIRKDFPMNEMIAHNQRIEENKKVMSGGLFGMIAQEEKEEKLEPISVKTYHNYKLISKKINFIDVIEALNRNISNLGSNAIRFFENNSEAMSNLVKVVARIDFNKIERYALAIERVKNDSYIQESPLSDVEISFFNEYGHEDENGNFFIIRLKNGHETKIKKIDKNIPGRYMGPKEKAFKTRSIVWFLMRIGLKRELPEEFTLSNFRDFLYEIIQGGNQH